MLDRSRTFLAGALTATAVVVTLSAARPTRQVRGDEVRTFLATLYANDPLTSSRSLADGSEGGVFEDFILKNHSNDLVFNDYLEDGFAVGAEGRREGAIVDLGSRAELGARYVLHETVGNFQGFASIRRENGEFIILADYNDKTTRPLEEAARLFDGVQETAPVQLDHVYLVRITERDDPDYELLAKLLVVAHEPGVYATVRWQLLD